MLNIVFMILIFSQTACKLDDNRLTGGIRDIPSQPPTEEEDAPIGDVTPPTIEITSPTQNSFINQASSSISFQIEGTCSEANQSVAISVDDTPTGLESLCDGANFAIIIDSTSLSEGSHVLKAVISDAAGNTTVSSPITVTVDTLAPPIPSVALSDPITNSTVIATTNPVNVAIGNDGDSTFWCTVEQANLTAPPQIPNAADLCWESLKPSSINLSGVGNRSVYVFSKDNAGNISANYGDSTIEFQFSNPTLTLSDPTTSSTNYIRQSAVNAVISNDSAAAKWCLSQSQSSAPPTGADICAGGSGPSNGWYTSRPTSFEVSTGDGNKVVYLWVATDTDIVNAGTVSDTITLDTTLPSTPTVGVTDPNSNNPGIIYVDNVNLSITGDGGATSWCVLEQPGGSTAPTKPSWNDPCFLTPKPTAITISSMGERKIYVFTRDVAFNISNTYGLRTVTRQVNSPPTAGDDNITVVTGDTTPQSIQVFANDTDPDFDTLTIASTTDGSYGTVGIHSTSKHLTYTLTNPAYSGSDSFTYTLQDPYGNFDTATVFVDIVPLSTWLNHKVITVSGSLSPTSGLTNFPIRIHIGADAQLSAKVQGGGEDILFTDNGGNILRHEIERYTSASGQLDAWVRIPSITANTDFDIRLYYNNASAYNLERPFDVWGSEHAVVFHFNEDPSITTDGYCAGENRHVCDSSPYHRNAKRNNALDISNLVIGKSGGALSFAGTGFVDYPCTGCPSYPFTISLWFNTSNLSGNLISYDVGPKRSLAFTGSYLHAGVGSDYRGIAKTEFSLNTWHHITAVYTSSSDHKVYLDGVDKTIATNDWWNAFGFGIGRRVGGSALNYDGKIDEIRIYSGSQSPELIGSHFKTQGDPSSYLTIGSEQ